MKRLFHLKNKLSCLLTIFYIRKCTYNISTLGGFGTARSFWVTDGNSSGKSIERTFHKANYVKWKMFIWKSNGVLTSKLKNQLLVTCYKDCEAPSAPNNRFKHFFHHKLVKPLVFAALGLPKNHGSLWLGCGCSKSKRVRPPKKLLAKATSDTMMSL